MVRPPLRMTRLTDLRIVSLPSFTLHPCLHQIHPSFHTPTTDLQYSDAAQMEGLINYQVLNYFFPIAVESTGQNIRLSKIIKNKVFVKKNNSQGRIKNPRSW